MHRIINIEGIGEKYAQQLEEAGVHSQEELLSTCSQRRHRLALAKKTGISYKLILKWTNQADLSRIKGIDQEYSELLEKTGVDSVPELAHRNALNLHKALETKNTQAHLVRHLPSLPQVEQWIGQAKMLPRAVWH